MRTLVPSQIENQTQHLGQHVVRPIRIEAVLRLAVVTVIITATKSLAEVILILAHVNVVSVVAVSRIAKCVAVLRIELPTVSTIRRSSAIAFVVTLTNCSPEQVSAILIYVEILVVAIVAIAGRSVVVVGEALQAYLVLAQTLPVTLLKSPLILTPLLL